MKKKLADILDTKEKTVQGKKNKHALDEVEYMYGEMFEEARFAIDTIAEDEHLPAKYRAPLKKMIMELHKIHDNSIREFKK